MTECLWERCADMLHPAYLQVDRDNNITVDMPHDEGYAWRIVKVFAKHGRNARGVWATDNLGFHLFIRTA
jgi:hypothetical protein